MASTRGIECQRLAFPEGQAALLPFSKTKMAPKLFVAACLVVMIAMAAPAAEAQLQGIVGAILNLVQIQGIVPCSQNASAALNETLTPVFPNAQVQLTCGAGNIISTATTNTAGIFSIAPNPSQFLLSEILSNCRLVVPTLLSSCNPTLPGLSVLQSTLQLAGNILLGLFNITTVIPSAFQFLPIV